MGKQWVRQQIKRNEVQDAVDRAIKWVRDNRRTAGISAGTAAGVILLAGLFLYSYHARQNAAWDQLSLAHSLVYSGQHEAALKKIEDMKAEHASTKAFGYGLLFAADLLYHKDRFADSAKYYQQLLDRGQPPVLMPFALAGLTGAQEAAGRCQEAAPAGERFLGTYPDHFLAPQVHSSLARCQAALGQTDAAKATMQKIVLQYPDTSWAAWAQERLKAMGGGV